jgi:hypothetical protein
LTAADHKIEIAIVIDIRQSRQPIISLQSFVLRKRLIDEMMLKTRFSG